MKIDEINTLPKIVEQADRSNRFHSAPLDATRKGQISARSPEDQYQRAPDSIIEAEYVEIYRPTHRPTEDQQWRNLIVEQETQTANPAPESAGREQIFANRYSRNSDAVLPPGSYINLLA